MSDIYEPKPDIAAAAKVASREQYDRLYRESIDDSDGFWRREAQRLDWFEPPETISRGGFEPAEFAWFEGGRLNASVNCIDRHLAERGDKTAIIWAADEPGEYRHISYRELAEEVGRMANVLKAHGVRRGDRVCIYLPMIPELVYTMLACARIGAVHSVVFAGFSAAALRDRILDAECRIVVTANEGLRGSKRIPLKNTVDKAVDGLDLIGCVLVARRTETEVAMREGRDVWLVPEVARQSVDCPPEAMEAGIHSSSSTPPDRRGSRRACCIPPAATWSLPP